jgi:hypothetical protein
LFHWNNGVAIQGVWHTNFFAVPTEEQYWPPVSPADEQDVLEAQWGKQLNRLQPPAILKTHNNNEKRFVHRHLSEHQAPWPIFPQFGDSKASLFIVGHKSWWRRFCDWLLRRP